MAQTRLEVRQHLLALHTQKPALQYQEARVNKNEIQLVFSGLFLFYKSFISSQDAVSCVFSPSCSEYGLLAMKHQGLVKGMLNTFDRLTRCHGLNPEKYARVPDSSLLSDPLQ